MAVYKDTVLNRKVSILFVEEDGNQAFYTGIITKMDISESKGGNESVQHFVEFDDGDELWFDLAEEEKSGRLRWPSSKRKNSKVDNPNINPMKKQKVKIENIIEEEELEEQRTSFAAPDPMPKSIDAIIRYMDKLEPEENFYKRQQDGRGGCSGTRNKMRKFAKKNPDHPGVQHWIDTNRWEPPDGDSLHALIELIKTMIK